MLIELGLERRHLRFESLRFGFSLTDPLLDGGALLSLILQASPGALHFHVQHGELRPRIADVAPCHLRQRRHIDDGDRVRVFNDRGSMITAARITDKARPGVVVALSIWWRKLAPDGTNANMLTGQALTDMGRAATFYDVLVEVERVSVLSQKFAR